MKNYYIDSDYRYTEIVKTLERFEYDTMVKCSILSLMALMDKDKPIDNINRLTGKNIMNKDKSRFKFPSTFQSCNYINIYIPSRYANKDEYDNHSKTYIGQKGTQFIITLVGGNSNNYRVIERYDI